MIGDATSPDSNPPGTTDIILDNQGDVVFKLGRNGKPVTHILVSSKVMALASPVFNAMFTHGFAEGQDLTSTSPRTILLPDDNTDSMVLLCKVLHHKLADVSKKLSLNGLVDLAILSAKYDCSSPLNYPGNVWAFDLMDSSCQGQVGEPLFAIYLLDLPKIFATYTRMLKLERYKARLKSHIQLVGVFEDATDLFDPA